MPKTQHTDAQLVLAVLLAAHPGHAFTLREIAEICADCGAPITFQGIYQIEHRALKKLRTLIRPIAREIR